MTYRFTAHNPYINEAASLNPYTYNIAMNAETAKKKGIKEGDTICLENRFGDKQTGKVKLSPVGTPAGGGSGRFRELGQREGRLQGAKGINPNALLRQDQHHFCPLSGAAEPTARVKAYKKQNAR